MVGTHSGIAIGEDGYSQMGLEDIACIRALPNIGIVQPADELETKQAIAFAVEHHRRRRHRHPRYDPALVSSAGRPEVRRLGEAPPWSPEHLAGPRGARRTPGEREPDVGLHAYPRRVAAPRHDVARNTIKAILQNHGIEPAPERGTKTPWKTFLAAHWDGLAAADYFTVEVLTWRGLVRYVVFFVMRLKTRTVEIAGITSSTARTVDDTDGPEPHRPARRLPP